MPSKWIARGGEHGQALTYRTPFLYSSVQSTSCLAVVFEDPDKTDTPRFTIWLQDSIGHNLKRAIGTGTTIAYVTTIKAIGSNGFSALLRAYTLIVDRSFQIGIQTPPHRRIVTVVFLDEIGSNNSNNSSVHAYRRVTASRL